VTILFYADIIFIMNQHEETLAKINELNDKKLHLLASMQVKEALLERPNDIDLLFAQAKNYTDMRDYLSAANLLQKILVFNPNEPTYLRLAAQSWLYAGELDRALEMANRFMGETNSCSEGRLLLTTINERNGRIEEARSQLSHVPMLDANYENVCKLEANLLYAEKEYEKVIVLLQQYHQWAEGAEGSTVPPDEDKVIDSWFLLAKVYNKIGEYDKAWESSVKAHEIANQNWDCDKYDALLTNVRSLFSEENLRTLARSTNPTSQPVFIVGNPRSGTSLLEQILSMHSDVSNAGELATQNAIQYSLQTTLDSFHKWPDCIVDMRIDDANLYSQEYCEATNWFSIGKKCVTNKALALHPLAGFLSLILPQSRMIMLHRHPLDNCVSCFTTNLVISGHGYTSTLEKLGRTWVARRKMQDFWTEVLESPVMNLHYDQLVTNQEEETKRLLEFLELPWQDDCIDFHKSTRVAATISYDQVNQKMYTSSSGRWKNYEKHLGPLIDIVGDYL
jgi:tetratricopeptide (TPR) repeat protein